MKIPTFLGGVCLLVGLLFPVDYLRSTTIDELTSQALHNNAELRFYQAEVIAMKGERTQAGLWKNPEISAQYGERRVKAGDSSLQNKGTTRELSIVQTFEFPGKGSLRKAIANKNIELAELGLQQFHRSLEGQVRSLALQYLTASTNADAAAEISERSSGLVKLLQERPSAGTQQLLELRIIEGSLIGLQQSAKEFIQAREETRLELNSLLGFPSSQTLKIESSMEIPRLAAKDQNTLILTGLSGNLQLKMRTVELEKAMKEVTAAKLDIAPDFSVGPFFSQDKAGDSEQNFGATLSLTFPLWNWNQGNIATANARQTQADAMLLDARRKVEAEIARRYRAYELNRNQMEQFSEDTMKKLREASDLADRHYRTGAIGIQIFLEMQRGFLSSLQIRNDALLGVWKNWLDLDLLTGGTISAPQSPKTPQQ